MEHSAGWSGLQEGKWKEGSSSFFEKKEPKNFFHFDIVTF
jgi:hypothetical protein